MYCDKLKSQALVALDAPVAETPKGKISGIRKDGTFIFRGIKYADARRFHMPEEVTAWEGTKTAITYGYVCPEPVSPVGADAFYTPHYYMPQDENCQYLNVWTQSLDKSAKKPVMLWMHGGGWFSGSAVEQTAYDGEELAVFGDVVVVSFNHRHNCLGALDLSDFGEEYAMSPFCGIGDVIMACRWVKENISAFGGDPENITVFGQSGGVSKIYYAMQCPQADGLFKRAAVDSGGIKEQKVPEGWTKKQMSTRLGNLTAGYLGLTKENIKEIETVPYWDLSAAAEKAQMQLKKESGMEGNWRWEPDEDGKFIIGSTLKDGFRPETKDIPMMIGNVFGESHTNMNPSNRIGNGKKNTWSQETVKGYCTDKWGSRGEEILNEFMKTYPENAPADVLFMDHEERDGQLEMVNKRVRMGAKVWNWLFKKESPVMGGTVAWHCSELPFVFHNASYIECTFEPGVSDHLENVMCSAWVNFARTGDPNGEGVPQWDACSTDETNTMIFDRVCGQRTDHDHKLRNMLGGI